MQRIFGLMGNLWRQLGESFDQSKDFQALEQMLFEIYAPVTPREAFRRTLHQRLVQAASTAPRHEESWVTEAVRPALIAGAALGVATVAALLVWRSRGFPRPGTLHVPKTS